MRVLSSSEVLTIVRRIETEEGKKLHSEPRIKGIPMAVRIMPK
jgi:hypothetical protein